MYNFYSKLRITKEKAKTPRGFGSQLLTSFHGVLSFSFHVSNIFSIQDAQGCCAYF